ncbi:hypothetical protein SDRG_16520 [Saprolegnia diclina VS20]|uniref:Uncharacterized protein n=1 Tax=Saprolegnia diclina (strain VS20) TaxID=1156394 RepID=T0PJQ9_SAPDV|nr:hypothetical protein SDRG_16520 [Saprolegnia diclina VS20]EQC25624.1 hypothetical protein SDRG_16520 [Saprolegnia diclina VS20]|eukprot:XP_008620956.1 hypothetical protein SDRG_16520 [Saprolegnia diclina VS20]
MGSAIDGLHITIDPVAILPHEGNALADLVLQCASLRSLIVIAHEAFGEQPVFDALLRATAHPAVQTLVLDLRSIEAPLHLGYHLRDWVRTAPATSLSLSNISRMPRNAAVAFCSALHANSTLAEIKLERVNGIDGFLGRRLPTSLRELYYDHERHEFIDDIDDTPTDAVLADLARALAPTRLEHLSYSYFGELALQPCLSSMLSVLTSLELVAAQLDDDRVPAFAAGLAQLGSLKTLVLVVPNYLYGEGFRSVLETLCVHCPSLETLDMADNRLDHDELMLLLEAVPRLPQLRKLEGWVHDWPFESVVPRFTTALVAASRQLRELNMTLITDGTTQQDLYDALATIENQPFYVETWGVRSLLATLPVALHKTNNETRCRLIL